MDEILISWKRKINKVTIGTICFVWTVLYASSPVLIAWVIYSGMTFFWDDPDSVGIGIALMNGFMISHMLFEPVFKPAIEYMLNVMNHRLVDGVVMDNGVARATPIEPVVPEPEREIHIIPPPTIMSGKDIPRNMMLD